MKLGLSQSRAVERVLDIFPKLFYFMPTIPPQQISIQGRSVQFAEPMDCVLWLLETLAKESKNDFCLQEQLEDLVSWWYPPKPTPRKSRYNFSKPINKLVDSGFIESSRYAADKRQNVLRLTTAGRELLQKLKQHRVQTITKFLADIPEIQLSPLVLSLEQVSKITWTRMRREARKSRTSET
jgi:DNA-binding PadR family transcriptional regulator